MKVTKMFRSSAAALGCLLALISCRQGPDIASGPLAPVDVKVVDHLVAVLGHESCVLELVDREGPGLSMRMELKIEGPSHV